MVEAQQDRPQVAADELGALLAAGRLFELEERLQAAEAAWPGLEVARLRGHLALEGEGPVADLVLAAEATTRAGAPDAPALTAHAIRHLQRAGARGRAKALLERARKGWPADADVKLVAEQLAADRLVGDTRAEWLARRDLAEGRWGEATARLQAIAHDAQAGAGRTEALNALADLARAGGRFGDAAQALERAAGLRPLADEGVVLRLSAALARWAAGEEGSAQAVATLEALREETERALRERANGRAAQLRQARAGFVHQACEDVLMALDRATARAAAKAAGDAKAAEPQRRSTSDRLRAAASASGRRPAVSASASSSATPDAVAARRAARPAWLPERPLARPCRLEERDPGAGIVRYLLEAAGLTAPKAPAPLPTMAHVRQALKRAGLVTRRVVVDAPLVDAALAAGARLVLEEELPVGAGFVLVVGHEPTADLLLLLAPDRPGPFLTSLEMQRRRCALSGQGGLLVTGAGAEGEALAARLAPKGDARGLAALDACQLDEAGRAPPRARAHELAARAHDLAEDVPLAWLRLGESILARLKAGELDPVEEAGGLVRLLVDARDRFADAEWPQALQAQLLELQGRSIEAGIAWADAAAIDPSDERNHLGMARASAAMSDLAAARAGARRALALNPGHAAGHALLAEVTLADRARPGALDEAALFAELAVDLAPGDAPALLALATVEEHRGQRTRARALLEQVEAKDPRDGSVRLRLLRGALQAGEWDRAAERAEALREVAPGSSEAWQASADVAFARGEGGAVLDLALAGLQRCGPDPELIERVVRGAACFLPPEARGGPIEACLGLLAGTPSALGGLAVSLAAAGLADEAEAVARHALEATGGGREQAWTLARLLLRRPRGRKKHRAEVLKLVEHVHAGSKDAPLPRLLLGALVVAQEPARALALAEGTEAAFPALSWQLTAKAFEGLKRVEQARRVRDRLPELYPAGVLDAADFLRGSGLHEEALELLDPAIAASARHVPCRVARALSLRELGRPRDALDDLRAAEAAEPDGPPRWLLIELAHALEDWPTLRRVAARQVEEGARASTGDAYHDVWPARARLAGACLALGDPKPRAELLAAAGGHPMVLALLCELELRLRRPEARERAALLEELAPGALGLVKVELR